ncbi:hypothetical protein [Pedobacter nototheniae]|uniref:hypothetical protein n=1 Tax=Pedobacter nototheniae TaxID=2488994 RepID=UPI0029309020|nr:hypothetical protein [Pedobacter nototheniae]
MKFAWLILLCLCSGIVSANVGCSTYNGLYPNSMGTTNPATGNIYYKNSGYIAFRYYDQDPNCGIRDNKITIFSPFSYCDVAGIRNYGVLVVYNPADNSCMQMPLDDFAIPFFVILSFGAYLHLKTHFN